MSENLPLFAACAPGLEPLLAVELTALGAAPQAIEGGVEFSGDLGLAMRSAFRLGTASHLWIRLDTFRCRAPGELERKARALPWRDWLRADVPLGLHAASRASRVYHTGLIAERVATAIAAALGAAPAAPESADAPAARLLVRFERDVCTLSLEATATPLHRRGYRLDGAKAPLREDLAHALVLASGFTAGDALLDPFCGSGTIAIEAAALARGLAPGRLRPPPLEHTARFDAAAWRAASATTPPAASPAPIAASDRDAGAIEAARANAARAGVAEAIEFGRHAVTAAPWLERPESAPARGVLVTNPPYGRRVAAARSLDPLYQVLGHRAARLPPGWRVALLAHDPRLARRTGIRLRAAFTTRHGGLSVTAMIGTAAPATAR